jgi:hypothetical protein
MSDWVTEPREPAAELDDNYPAKPFGTPTHFVPLAQKLDQATHDLLLQWSQGGIGEPTSYDGFGAPIYPWQQ